MEVTSVPRGKHGIDLVPSGEAMRMSGIDFLRGLAQGTLPFPPVAETAGLRFSSVMLGEVLFEAMPSVRFYNPMRIVHGGWIALLLDSAMGCAVHSTLAPGQTYATLDMSCTFVRPVREETGVLVCKGILLHSGKRVATAEGKIFDAAGALVAHGTETCVIAEIKQEPGGRASS